MRIIGIDVGSASIKAVELDAAFGRYEVHEYHEDPIQPGTDPFQAVASMLLRLPKAPDRIAVAMRTSQVTFRNLHLPTRDRKAIQAGVGFELDDELPFDIESAVYDYTVLAQGKQGTDLHVAATLKRNLNGFLAGWSQAGLDPDVISTEAWALRALFNRAIAAADQEEPTLFVQIGHERTLLYVHWKGSPVLTREIAWGGRDLTLAICQRYQVPLEQAEQAKRDHGFVLSSSHEGEDVTKEQVDFSGTLLTPMETLFQELRQAVLTCKNITHQNVANVYIAGGTSQLPGLSQVIGERLKLPVRTLNSLSAITASGVTYSEQADGAFSIAAGLALSMTDRNAVINLRKGEFSKQGRTREINFANLRRPLYAAGAVLASIILSLTVESQVYSRRLTDLDSQLERSVKSFFGQIAGSAVKTYLTNPAALKTAINKELRKQREINRLYSPGNHSPLDNLRALSAAIPKDVVVDMITYQAGAAPAVPYSKSDDAGTSMTFFVKDQPTLARLKPLIAARITNLQESRPEEVTMPDGTRRIKVTYTGKLHEGSYGK